MRIFELDYKNAEAVNEAALEIFWYDSIEDYAGELIWGSLLEQDTYGDRHFFAAYVEENLVGIVNLYEEDDKFWIGWFGVIKEHRGKGYGKEILDWICARAKLVYSCRTIYLYTSTRKEEESARRLYEKSGFILDKRENTGKGYRNIYYSKKI